MSVNEELEEHARHAESTFDKLVAVNMAIVASLLAIVSVFGQHYNTEQILKQQEASDQWAFYQAKDIRRYLAQAAEDLLVTPAKNTSPAITRYEDDAKRYKSEGTKIKAEAEHLEHERDANGVKARQFHFGEVFLEVSIVLLSLSILTKRRLLAVAGLGSAVVGSVWAALGFLG